MSGFSGTTGVPGGPPPSQAAPGSGRRRAGGRGRAGEGTATPPPPARGRRPEWALAHPEHREHTAWGAADSWESGPAGSGLLEPDLGELLEGDRDTPFPAPPASPRMPGRQRPRARIPGPRKEFVDAFDAPAGGPAGGPPGPGPQSAAEEPGPGGGRGRALGGAAAAAVVTVLAVVVAGQFAGTGKQSGEAGASAGTTRATDGAAASSGGRSTPSASASPSAPVATLSYDQAMRQAYPLKADLALSGRFRTVGGHQKAPGKGTVYRVRVDVEEGLPLDGGVFAEAVFKTLNDKRSWGHGGTMTFERVSSGRADAVVTLASPGTTAEWCAKSGLDTSVENVSCDSASTARTMINAYRWAQGSKTYTSARMLMYRQMVINHEVGHRLGHRHDVCPRNGALAPVMMQQTKWLTLNGVTCKPNPWPYPKG